MKGRELSRVEACLRSLRRQEVPLTRILVVEETATPRLAGVCQRWGADYITVPPQDGPFNKCRLANIAIDALETTHAVQVDMDVIATPDLAGILYKTLLLTPDHVLSVRPRRLPKGADTSLSAKKLVEVAEDKGDWSSWGMCMMHSTHGFKKLRFNEDFHGWGWEDTDYIHRAEKAGYQVGMLEVGARVLHQWHPVAPRGRAKANRRLMQ